MLQGIAGEVKSPHHIARDVLRGPSFPTNITLVNILRLLKEGRMNHQVALLVPKASQAEKGITGRVGTEKDVSSKRSQLSSQAIWTLR